MRLQAVDMSESGVGVVVQGEDASRIMDVLSQIAADIQRIHTPLDVEIELPRDGTVRAKGELKNIIGGQGNVYVRLGLKINLEENQRYISPFVGFSRPAIRCSRVLLPEPEGPIRPITSPSNTSTPTPFSASTPPG